MAHLLFFGCFKEIKQNNCTSFSIWPLMVLWPKNLSNGAATAAATAVTHLVDLVKAIITLQLAGGFTFSISTHGEHQQIASNYTFIFSLQATSNSLATFRQ